MDVRSEVPGDFEGKPMVHSSMYKNLRTNFPKEVMGYPDLPFPENLPSFPHHSDVLAYLKKYTTHYNIYSLIQFQTVVELVEPLRCGKNIGDLQGTERDEEGLKWKVSVRKISSGEVSTNIYDLILVCSGHFTKSFVPTINGMDKFPGKVTHSHVYRDPERYKGQSVLMVGASYSGKDLAIDLANHANVIYLCNRGVPITCSLPDNVEQLPAISEVQQDGVVVFADGKKRKVDSIILATGYLYSYPFLSENCGIQVYEGKQVFPLYKQTFNTIHSTMAFIGVTFGVLPIPMFDLQIRWIISVWIGVKSLPTKKEMIEEIKSDYQKKLQQGLQPRYARHSVRHNPWDFYKEIARLGGTPSAPLIEPVAQMVFEASQREAVKNLITYRDFNYVILGKEEWRRSRTH